MSVRSIFFVLFFVTFISPASFAVPSYCSEEMGIPSFCYNQLQQGGSNPEDENYPDQWSQCIGEQTQVCGYQQAPSHWVNSEIWQ